MSQQNPVLYGSRLYGSALYAITEDFETFNTILSDAASLSDIRVVDTIIKAITDVLSAADEKTTQGTKVLDDVASLTDALAKALTTHLSDSASLSDDKVFTALKVLGLDAPNEDALTISDAKTISTVKELLESLNVADQYGVTAQKVLADFLAILDSRLIVTATKDLTEFIDIREWISITLRKASQWQTVSLTQAPAPLYGRILYGQSLYGYTPNVVWNKPASSRTSFRNKNGESH